MNCEQALEHLDAVRPDRSDLGEPELAEARAHLDKCPACTSEFQRRSACDLQVVAMDVEIPEDLQARLLERIVGHEKRLVTDDQVTPHPRRLSRRFWFAGLATTALVLVATVAWHFSSPATGPVTLQQLRDWPGDYFSSVDDLEAMQALSLIHI